MRGYLTRGYGDRFDNTVEILEHVIAPKTENQIAETFQFRRSFCIFRTSLGVLPAIKLNDQTSGLATEIDHIGFDRHLTPKLQRIEPTVSQSEPQCALSIGLIATESSGCANT